MLGVSGSAYHVQAKNRFQFLCIDGQFSKVQSLDIKLNFNN